MLTLILLLSLVTPAWAVVTYQGATSAIKEATPALVGSPGSLVINKPAGTVTGEVMLASIAARPTALTVVVPTGWILYRRTEQVNGGPSTAPGGMSLFTYYKEVTAADTPLSNYTWTFTNSSNSGGGAAGVISRISGVDTLNPIDVYNDVLGGSSLTQTAPQVTTTTPNTILVAGISFLSACPFGLPTGTAGFVQKLQVQAPLVNNDTGTTLQVSAIGQAAAGLTGNVSATAAGCAGDNGIGHMFALASPRPDLSLTMVRNVPLTPGASASYTLTVSNLSPATSEAGTVTVVNTLPTGLTYNGTGSGGTGWACGAVGQVVTCTRTGLAAGVTAPALLLNVDVAAGATGLKTNTATVTGTGGLNGDGNQANNTDTDSYTIQADLAMTMTRGAALVPGTNATYTLNIINNGTAASGALSVTDTLPAGLTYVSGVGAGWSCVVGPPVTCTHAATLANGASTSLVLTVAVAAGAAGTTITNSATVTGTVTDTNLADNTDSDSYYIPLATYAYYMMDEASWTGGVGEVKDSSGNSRNASKTGAGVTTQTAPASGSKGDTCMGGVIPLGTGAGTQMGVSTPINPNALGLGSAGTVSFWYYNNVAWTAAGAANDRTLLDATGGAGTTEFWLVLQRAGSLRFMLDNASAASQTATGAVHNTAPFAANTWHHIAITWDFSAAVHTMLIFVDGVQDGIRNNVAVTSETPNYGTFFVGDSKTTVYTAPNVGNSANGVIDEVRFYATALTAAQITTDMNAAHACASLNHLEIQHASGTGLTCAASTLTVKACTDAAVPCANPNTGGVSGTLSATGTPTVNWDGTTGGATGAGFVIPSGSSTVTKNVQVATAGTVVFGITSPLPVPPSGITCNFGSPVCTFTASAAGFIFSNSVSGNTIYTIPTLASGTALNTTNLLWLRAVEASTANAAVCTPAIINQTVSVNLGYTCNNPSACQAGNLALINGSAVTATGTGVSLAFDANGSTPINSVRYDDVGQITLTASETAIPFVTATSVTLNGSSNTFVVKPDHFDLSGIQQTASPFLVNPAAANAAGNKFVMAGEPFSISVTAKNALGVTTKNYGQETTTPESVKLTPTNVVAGMVAAPAISGTFGTFAAGVATGTAFSWPEVGIITLTPSVSDGSYLGAGDVTGTVSGNVGRFYPDHFDTVVTQVANVPMSCPNGACPTTYNGFVYAGQKFSLSVTAKNSSGVATANYNTTTAFAKATSLSPFGGVGSLIAPTGAGALGVTSVSAFVAGTLTEANELYTFTTAPTVPTNIYIRASDSEASSLLPTPANSIEGGVEVASGRLKVSNAYGSELLPLTLAATAQYYTANGWLNSITDSVTTLTVAATYPVSSGTTTATPSPSGVLSGGTLNIKLSKPTAGAGVATVSPGVGFLTVIPGTATFGVYKSNNNFIYRRENY